MAGWDGFDVPALWQRVEPYGEGGAAAASMGRQVDAWRRFRDLTDEHARRIAAYREQVVAAWPPEKSPAAAAYVEHLDRLVTAMTQASGNAGQTAAGLDGVRGSLVVARGQVETVYREWRRRDGQKSAVSGGSRLVMTPSQDWKEDLNRQARAAMARMERAMADYQGLMTPPSGYQVDFRIQPEPMSGSDSPAGTAQNQHPSSPSSLGSSGPGVSVGAPGDGPVLSGDISTPRTAPVGNVIGRDAGAAPIGDGRAGVALPVPGTFDSRANTALPPGQRVNTGAAGGFGARPISRSGRVLPPGGVIEPSPHSAAPPPDADRGGGVSGAAHPPAAGGAFGGAAQAGRRRRGVADLHEPYVEWTAPQGGPAVWESKPDRQRHDPGPGVIGIDR